MLHETTIQAFVSDIYRTRIVGEQQLQNISLVM